MKHILLLLLPLVSLALHAQLKPVVSLPFQIEQNCIYVYCTVNGTDSLKFIFDTGADGSVINQSSIGKFQLVIDGSSLNIGSNGQNEVEESSKNEMTLGAIHKTDVTFVIIPYGHDGFDGVIGTDVMKGHIIEIDYHEQVLNFYDEGDKNIDYSGYTKMKLYTDTYPTAIKSMLLCKGKKYKGVFGIDTGADDALTIAAPFGNGHDLVSKMTKMGSSVFQGSDGSAYEMPIVLCPEVEFAEKRLYRIPTALSNATEGVDASDKLAGFYGNAFLKRFNTIIDYKDHFIYFKINKNLYTEL